MEMFIAILMYLGLLSPDAAHSMSDAEMQMMVNANHAVIEHAQTNENTMEAAAALEFMIDRRED